MIESLAAGTRVIALHNGSVPEGARMRLPPAFSQPASAPMRRRGLCELPVHGADEWNQVYDNPYRW